MPDEERRPYRSSLRQKQADETRLRIVEVAGKLLESSGYAGMTIEAIAEGAQVSTQTVYGAFGSKTGILAELFKRAIFSTKYQELVRQATSSNDPTERLEFVAKIARTIYDAEDATLRLVEGAGAVAPKLAEIVGSEEEMRYESQKPMLEFLQGAGALKADLEFDTARDIMWVLTNRANYRMLVITRKWSSDRYEAWLAESLKNSLLSVPKHG